MERVKGSAIYTMATPDTTTIMLPMTERLKILPSQTLSTPHTKGMISSFAICATAMGICQAAARCRTRVLPEMNILYLSALPWLSRPFALSVDTMTSFACFGALLFCTKVWSRGLPDRSPRG